MRETRIWAERPPRGAGLWRAFAGALLLFLQAGCGCSGSEGGGGGPPVDADATLRELALEADFEIGTAFDGWQFDEPQWREVVTREFTLATVNWGVYWGEVEPAPDQFDFAVMDSQIDFAEANGMRIRGHALYFPSESPAWLEDPALSDAELEDILTNHVETIVSRYRDRIHEWVVVNEPYLPTYREEDVLYQRFGYDYIEIAFEAARAADPAAVLIFNDTDNHIADSETTDLTHQIVAQLQEGSLIDGVGVQMHLSGDDPPDKQDVIDTLSSYGVPVYVTEFDVDLSSVSGSELQRFLLQGNIYQDMIEACRDSGVCASFTVWGINDQYSWLEWPEGDPSADPTPFDEMLRRKPAWAALATVLAQAAP